MTPELRKRIEEKAKEHLGNYDPNTDVAWTKMNDFLAGAEAMHQLMSEDVKELVSCLTAETKEIRKLGGKPLMRSALVLAKWEKK